MKWFNLSDGVNALSMLGALVILALTTIIFNLYIKKIKNSKVSIDEKEVDEKWDGIGELKNNVPSGWLIAFILILLWGLWYFFLGFPLKSFSQIGQYNTEVKEYNNSFEAKWSNLSQDELQQMGQSIFLVQCSQCHGVNADGMEGKAQNLVLWGKEEGIVHAIKHGSKGGGYALPEMAPIDIPYEDALTLAAYVMQEISELKVSAYKFDVNKGKELFESATCASCHGDDGKGNGGMAPDLSKYGTTAFLSDVLKKGKKGNIGIMPSFEYAAFAPVQIEALNVYIQSLNSEDE